MENEEILLEPWEVRLRPLRETDDLGEITRLVNSAYQVLMAMGFNYTGATQDENITRNRIKYSHCFVGEKNGRIVATITLTPPGIKNYCELFRRSGVAHLGQFAVSPALRGQGLGEAIMLAMERIAMRMGFTILAGDTAEGATHLIQFYKRLGWWEAEHEQWEGKTYRSLLLIKELKNHLY